jgi:uncharacterized protein YjbI with pentapeptide repeats
MYYQFIIIEFLKDSAVLAAVIARPHPGSFGNILRVLQFLIPRYIWNLSSVKFDGSLLRAANFTKANLENALFDAADLARADFTSANLRKARLTDPPLIEPSIQAIVIGKALWAATGPVFECADLTEADFTESTMFGFYWTDVNGTGYFPRWFGANLKGAKLASFTLFSGHYGGSRQLQWCQCARNYWYAQRHVDP